MAQAARKELDYLSGVAAYDMFANQPVRRAPEQEPLPQQTPSPELSYRVRPQNLLFIAVSCVAALCVLLLVLFAHQKVYEATYEVNKLQSQLAALQEEQVMLRSAYDSSVDLVGVEKRAVEELGMGRPVAGQTVYLDLSGEDRAEVLNQKEENLFTELSDFIATAFRNLGAYLSTK